MSCFLYALFDGELQVLLSLPFKHVNEIDFAQVISALIVGGLNNSYHYNYLPGLLSSLCVISLYIVIILGCLEKNQRIIKFALRGLRAFCTWFCG